jgi:hypothetical protein
MAWTYRVCQRVPAGEWPGGRAPVQQDCQSRGWGTDAAGAGGCGDGDGRDGGGRMHWCCADEAMEAAALDERTEAGAALVA